MTTVNTGAKERVPQNKSSNSANAKEKHSQESKKAQKKPAQRHSDDKATQDTVDSKREKDASTTNLAEEQELVPVHHPQLPNTSPPRYFVNKNGVVCSNRTGKLKPMKPLKISKYCIYEIKIEKKGIKFKLEEIMAYTFSEHFDRDKHYVAYKDGDRNNCAWSNLIICDDLATLQQTEIDRLQRLHPGTKYTVVRNIHDTLTFERYLVSDSGDVYSLARREYLALTDNDRGYLQSSLMCDTGAEHSLNFSVHRIVIQSFMGRRTGNFHVTHVNGDKHDNMLKNLAYTDPTKRERPKAGGKKEAKTQGNKRIKATLPPVTDETRWKTIGVLPWNGLSFSKHEVSDMGHVRNKNDFQLLNFRYSPTRYAYVHVRDDQQSLDTFPRYLRVSRLVANAFVDGYSETHNAVMHLNGNRLDNRAQNLKWVSIHNSSVRRNAFRVVASLVDDPKVQKEFPSMMKAKRELSTCDFRYLIRRHGNSFTEEVTWDGEKRMALIQVFPCKQDEE